MRVEKIKRKTVLMIESRAAGKIKVARETMLQPSWVPHRQAKQKAGVLGRDIRW